MVTVSHSNVIYKITNLITGKCYIGQAKDLDKRIKGHKRNVGKVKSPLYSAIQKHGWDNFEVTILHTTDRYEELDDLEVRYIVECGSLHPHGYNLTQGGTGGDTVTNHPNKETLHLRRKGRPPWNKGLKGAQVPWNKGTKGVMKPNDTTFKSGQEHSLYGKKQSPETLAKRRANTDYAKIFENFPWEQKAKKCMKPILQCDLLGNIIMEKESATTVSKELGIPRHKLYQYLDTNKPLNGFLWMRKK